jgi:tetratricopeptide (TPR) repeat protein
MPLAVLVLASFLGGGLLGAGPQEAPPPPAPEESDPRTLLGLAVAAQQAGELERAVSLYERVLASVGDEPRILSNLGAAYSRLGRYPEAVERYERALALAPAEAAIRQNLALALYKTGELRKAAAEAARVVEVQPDNESATLLLAECHLALGEHDDVVRLLRREDGLPLGGRAAQYLLGTALLAAGRAAEAQAVLDGVLKEDSAEAHVVLATMYVRDGECGKARPEIEKALGMNPQLPFVNYLRGKCLMEDEVSDWAGAAEAFRRELAVNPSHLESNLLLGELLRQEGRHEGGAALRRARGAAARRRSRGPVLAGRPVPGAGPDERPCPSSSRWPPPFPTTSRPTCSSPSRTTGSAARRRPRGSARRSAASRPRTRAGSSAP